MALIGAGARKGGAGRRRERVVIELPAGTGDDYGEIDLSVDANWEKTSVGPRWAEVEPVGGTEGPIGGPVDQVVAESRWRVKLTWDSRTRDLNATCRVRWGTRRLEVERVAIFQRKDVVLFCVER